MKTNEEKEVRKEEITTENSQRRMLKDEELEQVTGGASAIEADPTLGQNNDMETNDVRGFTVFKLDIE